MTVWALKSTFSAHILFWSIEESLFHEKCCIDVNFYAEHDFHTFSEHKSKGSTQQLCKGTLFQPVSWIQKHANSSQNLVNIWIVGGSGSSIVKTEIESVSMRIHASASKMTYQKKKKTTANVRSTRTWKWVTWLLKNIASKTSCNDLLHTWVWSFIHILP